MKRFRISNHLLSALIGSLVAVLSSGCGSSFDGESPTDSAIALGSQRAAAQACRAEVDRAMWVNRPGPSSPMAPDVVGDLVEQNLFFDFSTRPDIDIRDIFLSVPIPCRTSLEDPLGWTCTVGGEGASGRTYRSQLHDLVRRAHDPANNIRVHSLFGNATRALRENHSRIRREVRAILEFNNAGAMDERFEGIHLDVEPHTLPEFRRAMHDGDWDTVRDIFQQFLDMNVAVVEELAEQNVALGVDVPDSWHPSCREGSPPGCPEEQIDFREEYLIARDGVSNYPTYHLMNIVKDIAVMSYHRSANTMIRKTEHAVAYAARPEVAAHIYVGVQTAPPCPLDPSDPSQCSPDAPPDSRHPSQTMGHLTRAEMEEQLCGIDSYFAERDLSSFQGFAYFKYVTYRDMRE